VLPIDPVFQEGLTEQLRLIKKYPKVAMFLGICFIMIIIGLFIVFPSFIVPVCLALITIVLLLGIVLVFSI